MEEIKPLFENWQEAKELLDLFGFEWEKGIIHKASDGACCVFPHQWKKDGKDQSILAWVYQGRNTEDWEPTGASLSLVARGIETALDNYITPEYRDMMDIIQRASTQIQNPSRITISNHRRSGRTTRQIDQAIQELFKGRTVTVLDHSGVDRAHSRMMKRIAQRLEREHDGVRYEVKGRTIKLENQNPYLKSDGYVEQLHKMPRDVYGDLSKIFGGEGDDQ